ncbi:PemK family transcriptional regulator [Candidatus Pacearchaeota archaeon CG1_02_31_27]|nr:MAG: PemK family transcriptional regulator [Candidatus Pacearchaeota archaeon CG1_02_31_27]PIN92109.1 MAG: PemK family transcriptional regulator [Candidatus Pacearchaeota archaeon CG10_big_fil_rev_8_21_14_0_10_31_59]PIZ80324.1 MAG: PemK family transcriptional regulator [Candidatus Pacearchaeota archaeon CG_4_10_14_0_2_um_filter_31_10]
MLIKRGDIFLANLEPVKGSEQGGIRPVLIIQNDISNKYSPVTIIAAITSKIFEREFPTNVFLTKKESGLDKDSTILLNQIRTIDKSRLIKKIKTLDLFLMEKVELAIKISLGLKNS